MQLFIHTQQLLWLVLFKIIVEFKIIKMRRGWTSFIVVDSHQLANATVKQCVMLYKRNRKSSEGAVTELLWSVHFSCSARPGCSILIRRGKLGQTKGVTHVNNTLFGIRIIIGMSASSLSTLAITFPTGPQDESFWMSTVPH